MKCLKEILPRNGDVSILLFMKLAMRSDCKGSDAGYFAIVDAVEMAIVAADKEPLVDSAFSLEQ